MVMTKNLILIGSGGHAGAVADAASSAGFTVIGFFDPSAGVSGSDRKVLNSLDGIDIGATSFALGIGANYSREDAYVNIKSSFPYAHFPAIVHSSAFVSPLATLAEGVVVMAMASVGPGCVVEVGALLNTGSSLDHDSFLGPFASLGPGARTGGNVRIADRTVIGLNAGILQGVSIGSDTVVGAHSFVNKDMPGATVAYGVPVAPVRQRQRDDRYY
jgi:sugar O-acyltransferase (sialic acid O-acetyltransferase NeuD family)